MAAVVDAARPAPPAVPVNRIGITLTTMVAMISMIMSSTMVNVAVPDIMGAFGIGQDEAHWMATGFLSAMTVSMLLNAWLVDRFGLRTVFLGAVALFSVASVAGQLAPTFTGLALMRVAQGCAAGIIQPLAMSTVFLAYPPEQRGRAMGWFGMGIVFGPTIGPVLGGLIVDSVSWRWVFSAPVPIMVLSAGLAWIFLPGRLGPPGRVSMNFPNFALIALALALFLNGITEGQREGWGTERTFLLLFGAALALALFLFREAYVRSPLIQLRLFGIWTYSASAIVAFIFGAGMFGSLFLVPIMVQTVQGFTATKAGLMLLPGGLVAMAVFPLAGRFAQQVAPSVSISAGLLVFGLSAWWLAESQIATAFWTLALLVAVGRVGLGIVIPALNLAALDSVPRDLVQSASGTLNFIRMTGAAIGVNALAIIIDGRIATHREGLVTTQTPSNDRFVELARDLADRLAAAGVPEADREPAALAYIERLISLKAQELAFHDGFLVLAAAFAAAIATTLVLMRGIGVRSRF